MKTDEIIPILETMNKEGDYSMEVCGGGTFDYCIRVLNEDPREGLRLIRDKYMEEVLNLKVLLINSQILRYKVPGAESAEKGIIGGGGVIGSAIAASILLKVFGV